MLCNVLVNGFDGELTGDVAAGVTAHAIGYDPEAEFIINAQRVLISLADPANVCEAEALPLSCYRHAATLTGPYRWENFE
jgi:hypothetical protein